MATFRKFEPFVEALAEKKHNLGSDTLKVALTTSVGSDGHDTLSDITEISYTNLSSRTLTVTQSSQSGGVYYLKIADLTLTSTGGSTGPFRYIVIYNDTATNDDLIGYYDYGSSITLADGEALRIDFDGASGFLTIT